MSGMSGRGDWEVVVRFQNMSSAGSPVFSRCHTKTKKVKNRISYSIEAKT